MRGAPLKCTGARGRLGPLAQQGRRAPPSGAAPHSSGPGARSGLRLQLAPSEPPLHVPPAHEHRATRLCSVCRDRLVSTRGPLEGAWQTANAVGLVPGPWSTGLVAPSGGGPAEGPCPLQAAEADPGAGRQRRLPLRGHGRSSRALDLEPEDASVTAAWQPTGRNRHCW